jgi:hypothetical protein
MCSKSIIAAAKKWINEPKADVSIDDLYLAAAVAVEIETGETFTVLAVSEGPEGAVALLERAEQRRMVHFNADGSIGKVLPAYKIASAPDEEND